MTAECKERQSFTLLFTRFTLIKEFPLHARFTHFTLIKERAAHSFTHHFTQLHAPQLHALLHAQLHGASRENENRRSQLHASFTHLLHAPPPPKGGGRGCTRRGAIPSTPGSSTNHA